MKKSAEKISIIDNIILIGIKDSKLYINRALI